MIEIRKTFSPDGMLRLDYLTGVAFSRESGAHRFIISGPEAFTGTVTASFMRADGQCVIVTGSLDEDGRAVVTADEDCYLVPGRMLITVYVTDGGVKTCVYAGLATVYDDRGSGEAPSGETTRTIEEMLEEILEGVDNAQQLLDDAGELLDDVTAEGATQVAAVQAKGDQVIASIPSDYSTLTGDVSSLKSAMTHVEDGTGVLVEKGYFTNAQKAVDTTVGFGTMHYDAVSNSLTTEVVRTSGATTTGSVNFGDFGLTKDNSGITITQYPYLVYAYTSDIPAAVNVDLRIWAYAGSSYSVVNHKMTVRDGTPQTIDLRELFAENNLSASYNVAYIRSISTDSFTFTSLYEKLVLNGFFTAEQATGMNLSEKMDNLTDDVLELKEAVPGIPPTIKAYAEKAATEAPLTIKQVNGILNENGTYTGTSNFISSVTDKIKCSEGDVFYYFGQCSDTVVACMWFDADGNILSYDKPSDAGIFKHITYTAPANADTVIFTSYIGTSSGYAPALVVTRKTTYTSPLSMKVWYPCGDSFTAGEFSSAGITDYAFTSGKYTGKNKTYPYHIGNRTNVDVRRGSTSGETMATFSGGTVVFSDPNYAYGYKSVGTDADYITLWFGINDAGRSIPIGTIDDATNATFYGAWNVVLDDLTTRCTKAHIGIIVSNNLASAYVDAVIAVAKKWGIPYLDLNYDNSVPLIHYSLRPDASADIKAKRNTQFAISSENHHPNLLAHEYESYFIEKWLLSL